MKNFFKKFLCGLLSSLMLIGAMSMTVAYAEEAGKTENAEESNSPYIVDFSNEANVVKGAVDGTTVTATSTVLSFSEKEKGAASFYGVNLTEFPIVGNVYTLTYWIECTDVKDRVAFQPVTSGEGRIGWVTTNNGKTDTMQFVLNGTVDTNTSVVLARDTDTGNSNRQHFKIVVDGVKRVMRLYMLSGGKYQFGGETVFSTTGDAFLDYLRPILYSYDTLTGDEHVSLGEVTIEKGDTVGLREEALKLT